MKIGMLRRIGNIALIAVLALNLMGVWAFASSYDCGMACCQPSETAKAGIPTFESPSCCQTSGITCTFESVDYEELFDEVLCCYTGAHRVSGQWDHAITSLPDIPSSDPSFPPSESSTGPPQNTPIYIHNLTLIC